GKTGGYITLGLGLNSILGKETPYNYIISHFVSPNDLLATIQVSSVPEPSTLILLGLGSTGAVFARRWWRRRFGKELRESK
ncbi:MAG TPA: PEP-CTERM sorting domain-containing protein, partial [Isosphaeraceae bacterium]|nr:PEP-CTERM sorting domain-containing protein [Isosphaeraceae bacterium]